MLWDKTLVPDSFDTDNANISHPARNGDANRLMISADLEINLTIVNFQTADSNERNGGRQYRMDKTNDSVARLYFHP